MYETSWLFAHHQFFGGLDVRAKNETILSIHFDKTSLFYLSVSVSVSVSLCLCLSVSVSVSLTSINNNMFFYLSKKVAIPNCTHLNCISWNQHHGWISMGGNNGLLKVLNIERVFSSTTTSSSSSSSSSTNVKEFNGVIHLSSNQSLAGHSGEVTCLHRIGLLV